MANLFDVYNDGLLIDHTEGEKLETGETPITITGLTADTTYDKVQVAYTGSYNKSDVPSFKTKLGHNLLLGTKAWIDSTRWDQRNTVTANTYKDLVIAATSSAWKSPVYKIQNAGILKVGNTYTFSTYVRNTSDTDTEVAGYYDDTIVTPGAVSKILPAHTDWTRMSRTFKVIKDPTTSTQGIRWESRKDLTNGEIQFAGYKLEGGNKATPWIPAPEDNIT